jgi:hypothetical protein
LDDFEFKNVPKESLTFLSGSPQGEERRFAAWGAARSKESAQRYRRLKELYRKASMCPWMSVVEDDQHPPWEEILDQRGHGDGEY